MAKNKRKNTEEIPVDKVEAFLERNFRKILFFIGAVIGLFIVVYIVFTAMQSSKQQKISQLGQYENMLQSGIAQDANIKDFVNFGTSISEIADYTRLKAATYYIKNGNVAEAEKLLQQVGKQYRELADSVLFDLGHNVNISQYINNSYLTQLWEYRDILTSDYDENRIEEFSGKYSDSRLTELLKNWEQF